MGTLIFHILLFSLFILADIDRKGSVQEQEMVIEFENILPEPETEETPEENQQPQETSPGEQAISQSRSQISNRASNRLSKSNEFFDEDYQREVEAAQKLVSDVNNQLSKEAVDIDDIKMPVETTEGMDRDSIKNVIYTGESNIVYYLENRYHVSLPIPVYLAQGGGKIIVDIIVDRNGSVISAEPRPNPAIRRRADLFICKSSSFKNVVQC